MKKMVVPFEVKSITEDDDYFYFEGYASTFGDIDLGNDEVQRGAFADDVKEKMAIPGDAKLPALWQHEHDEPVGAYNFLQEDKVGLFVKGRMPKADTFVSGRVVPQMRVGSVKAMSIGYTVVEWAMRGGVRLLEKLKLWEISLVTTPMNPKAVITGLKSNDAFHDLPVAAREHAWDAEAALARVKSFLAAEKDGCNLIRKSFLWSESESVDDIEDCKFLIADVIDGKLTAVPRAIFSVVAGGSKGIAVIPDADRDSVISGINHYYGEMDLESPFRKSSVRVDDLSTLTERDLEKLFKSGVCFTNQTSKRLASALKTFLRDEGKSGNREDSTGAAVVTELQSLLAFAKTLTSKIEGK